MFGEIIIYDQDIFSLYMKYSASAVPAYGAMYCKDADSLAVEESTME